MTVLEIVLLIIGVLVFIASFLVGKKNGKDAAENPYALTVDEVDKLIADRMKDASDKLASQVDETIEYSVGKTERNMERVTNEKMMAISEYAETVLNDIHKNHEEVVFLYDMLNDKQTNLKNTVREVEATAKSAKETVKQAHEQAEEMKQEEAAFVPFMIAPDTAEEKESQIQQTKPKKKVESLPARKHPMEMLGEEQKVVLPTMLSSDADSEEGNQNEQILALHKAGKSNMAIAKQLGLGVGEVKLVIDLFKEM